MLLSNYFVNFGHKDIYLVVFAFYHLEDFLLPTHENRLEMIDIAFNNIFHNFNFQFLCILTLHVLFLHQY